MAVSQRFSSVLTTLLVATFLNGLAWAAMVPMWQTPDEQAHFAQAQNLAAGFQWPGKKPSTSQDIVIAEKYLGTFRDPRGNNQFTYHPEYRIEYSDQKKGVHEDEINRLPLETRSERVIKEATGYPPLYYRYIALVNRLFWPQGLIIRVFVSRIATLLLTTLAVYVAYLLAKEVFRTESLALIAAGMASFHPMGSFVGSGVTSDALMNLVYPLGVLGIIRLSKKITRIRFWSLLVVLAAGFFTKLQSVFLLVLSLPVLVVSATSSRLPRFDRYFLRLSGLGLGAIFLAIIIRHSGYTVPAWLLPTKFVLPEVGHLGELSGPPSVGEYLRTTGELLYRQGFPWYWGVYRWLSLTLPLGIYRLIKVIILVSVIGWAGGVFKRGIGSLVDQRALGWVVASSGIYPSGILIWNFFFWKNHGFPIGIQGRYFLPNLPEQMILLLIGLVLVVRLASRFNNRVRCFWPAAGMVVFNWYSLWFVSASYYDASSWSRFWLQASQYKPGFFKTPWLPMIVGAGMISSLLFYWRLLRYNSLEEREKSNK